jgi:2-dehydro-3-deoxyphosphogluconate aldolase/(4S)-4-hydroxy-2-oxoglutarate aldolase
MDEIIEVFQKIRIIPVVTIRQVNDANLLADALVRGGLPCAEITFRTNEAAAVIEKLSKRADILSGAGSVLVVEQAKTAIAAGAKFIVSPGLNPKVLQFCAEQQIPIFPGTCTPTDFTLALEHGLRVVKFFPAESLGGVKTLQAMAAPFPMLKFLPTGGITPKNVLDYLGLPQVLACGGSWMVKEDLLQEKKFDTIQQLVQEAVNIAKQL